MNDLSKTTLFPSTTTVKRLVMRFGTGGETHYSIRLRSDGLFQVYHDDPIEGLTSPMSFTTNNGAASSTARRQRKRSY
jgi:hypothetical protein